MNGFPEYFDISDYNSAQNICMRWEKSTGRIDLAVAGKWLVGDNVYAANRKGSSLPRRGKMTIGAGLKLDETAVEGSYVGSLADLVIWSDFFSPSVLITASKQPCSEGLKSTKSWLSFDTVIAGVQNIDALQLLSGYSGICAPLSLQKKRDAETSPQLLQNNDNSEKIAVDYDKYLADSSKISEWIVNTGTGSVMNGDVADVIVRSATSDGGTEGQFKILPQKELCMTNEGARGLSSLTITFGDAETDSYYDINGKVFTRKIDI